MDSTRPARRLFLISSVFIVLFAASLRIHHISQRSIWLDEAIAANISRGTLSQTLTLTRDLHSAPIVDPLILYAIERVADGPLAVRLPSFFASLLAVLLMLSFVKIPSVDYKSAGLSALMLTISAAQVRYAQEVREYSLSVLYAGILLYFFLSSVSRKEQGKPPILLYLALFLAPLVQYGLVLFSFGILSALFILAFTDDNRTRRIRQIVIASGFLAVGGVLSLFLTLRYQWGDDVGYLKYYFWTPGSGLVRFIVSNTHHLITFLLPGLVAASISTIAILIYLATSIRARTLPPLALLAFTSCGIVLVCSILRLYPYGSIRQCLFLAPVLCLLAAVSLAQVTNRFPGRAKSLAFIGVVCVVLLSGVVQIRLLKPYAEVEDVQNVLHSLQNHIEPGDGVYIYPGAVFSVDFYMKKRDPRFMYGNYHQQDPDKYVSEMLAGLDPEAKRLWIVLSHIHGDEDKRILTDLSGDWDVEPVLTVTGSALYLATRRSDVADSTAIKFSSADTSRTASDHIHDSFWEWNIRNSRQTAPFAFATSPSRKPGP